MVVRTCLRGERLQTDGRKTGPLLPVVLNRRAFVRVESCQFPARYAEFCHISPQRVRFAQAHLYTERYSQSSRALAGIALAKYKYALQIFSCVRSTWGLLPNITSLRNYINLFDGKITKVLHLDNDAYLAGCRGICLRRVFSAETQFLNMIK